MARRASRPAPFAPSNAIDAMTGQAVDFPGPQTLGTPRGDFDGTIRIKRKRKSWKPGNAEERAKIANRVVAFHSQDISDRSIEAEMRLQRYAKYRMLTSGKSFPWANSSDIGLPDLATHVHRTEDTLVNAVNSQTPPVLPKALDEVDREKQETVSRVLMHQTFTDQNGTRRIAELAHNFAGPDGCGTLYIPWVTETRKVVDRQIIEPVPPSGIPADWFAVRVAKEYPDAEIAPRAGGWDYDVTPRSGDPIKVSFFTTENGEVEMIAEHEAEVFDGPCWIVKPWEDVLKPAHASNLQAPSPSNPGGASHVILIDRNVTLDEIARLQRSGFYDLMDDKALDALRGTGKTTSEEQIAEQKQEAAGRAAEPTAPPAGAESHKTVTRLTCFDVMDIDDDGIDEDVVLTVILETKTLVRARILTEMYPVDPPERPLFSEDFLPDGLSLVELLESTHDAIKMQLDMTIDVGALTGIPFFGYRATGAMKPETLRIEPGAGIPLQDPQRDLFFPTMPNNQLAAGINLITLLNGMQERISMQGELQFGRVPTGKASALRTLGGMQSVMMQGEARPARILGRFFGLLGAAFRFQHEMNRRMLKPGKVVMYVGPQEPGKQVYQTIASRKDLGGRYQFEFVANPFNTSLQALQQQLGMLMQAYLTPLMFQLGVVRPDGAYRLARDFGKAHGQDPDQYLSPPTPDALLPAMSAEDILLIIIRGGTPPPIRPIEPGGWQEHLQKLLEFMQGDNAGFLTPEMGAPQGAIEVLQKYIIEARTKMLEQAAMQRVLAAAAGQGQPGGGTGGPEGAPQSAADAQAQPMISGPGEMMDETMPGAGGGANTGMMQ